MLCFVCFPLKIIVGGVASSPQDVKMYASCTMLAASLASEPANQEGAESEGQNKGAIETCIEWLMDNEFIHIEKEEDGKKTRNINEILLVFCAVDLTVFLLHSREILPHTSGFCDSVFIFITPGGLGDFR